MTKDIISDFDEIINYLLHRKYPAHMSGDNGRKRNLRVKASRYKMINGKLFHHLHNGEVILDINRRKYLLKGVHGGFGSSIQAISLAGHFGINKTYSKLADSFWWPNMREDVVKYVNSCDICHGIIRKFDKPSNNLSIGRSSKTISESELSNRAIANKNHDQSLYLHKKNESRPRRVRVASTMTEEDVSETVIPTNHNLSGLLCLDTLKILITPIDDLSHGIYNGEPIDETRINTCTTFDILNNIVNGNNAAEADIIEENSEKPSQEIKPINIVDPIVPSTRRKSKASSKAITGENLSNSVCTSLQKDEDEILESLIWNHVDDALDKIINQTKILKNLLSTIRKNKSCTRNSNKKLKTLDLCKKLNEISESLK
ncbi:uncharacterized protein LOC135926537 isoform X2 [Gordionus sp. m RMFG-2023]|uniref:uncharacterized protein LOC135926537 isoform X2 n=1 Tax=Gordionus sp. m RMFG-2023 TaxID=3053472 RepID=UPI0031FD6A5A